MDEDKKSTSTGIRRYLPAIIIIIAIILIVIAGIYWALEENTPTWVWVLFIIGFIMIIFAVIWALYFQDRIAPEDVEDPFMTKEQKEALLEESPDNSSKERSTPVVDINDLHG